MPQNGEVNEQFGVYRSLCCGIEITMPQGYTFPDCPNHRKLSTVWKAGRSGPLRKAGELPIAKTAEPAA